MQSKYYFLKSMLSLGLGYLRWTQLTPMILIWGFSLIMLLTLTFVHHQEQSVPLIESFLEWLMRLPFVGERITVFLSAESTPADTTTGNLDSFIFSSWSVLSLVFMVTGMVISTLFGPFQPWRLKRKVLLAGVGAVLLLTGLVGVYYMTPEKFNGGALAWMLNFSLISLLVFGISAYCLSVSHFLVYLNNALMATTQDYSITTRS